MKAIRDRVGGTHVFEKKISRIPAFIPENKSKAIKFKENGNKLLVKGKYEDAIKEYTSGIDLDNENPHLFANRGWAKFKKEAYAEAEEDFSEALVLDPLYQKVIKRRAQTRFILKKFTSAEEDVRRAIKISPTDKEARVMLEKILHPERFVNDQKKDYPYDLNPIKKPTGVILKNYLRVN